jgi:hypothetical protein
MRIGRRRIDDVEREVVVKVRRRAGPRKGEEERGGR